MAVTTSKFLIAGELMASSLLQRGPVPNFMADWVFDYIVEPSSLNNVNIDTDLLSDKPKNMVTKVRMKSYWNMYFIFNHHFHLKDQ